MEESQPHVVMVPSPGMGHLIPLAEFANLLVSRHHFTVSLLLPTAAQPTAAQTFYLESLPDGVSYAFLPPAHLPDGGADDVTGIALTISHSLPSVRASLLARRAQVVALVTDPFGTDLFDVARDLGIPPYLYFTSSAMHLSLLLHLPRLDETLSCDYRDMPDPVVLPGCVPIYGVDFPDAYQYRRSGAYQEMLRQAGRHKLAEGIFVNTFEDLESGAIRGLQTEDPTLPPIYPVGPIIQPGSSRDSEGSECLRWLDQQPSGSVLFVSFGSQGCLSREQLNELAIGLERSGNRFLWVVRSPKDVPSSGSLSTLQTQDDQLFSYLPNGFVDRTKDHGLLVPSWAPQVEVLSHGSTGGFLTHCGWNSSLESIYYGVPMIAWPLYAGQRMNAVFLNQGLNVALRPNTNKESGLVEANEIASVVRDLMEGEEGKKARNRIKELSELANKTISNNDGSSMKLLYEVAHKWIEMCTL